MGAFAKKQRPQTVRQSTRHQSSIGVALHKPLSFWPFAISFRNYDKQSALGSNQPRPAIQYSPEIHHQSEVNALAISPDGKLLAAALGDGSIDIVDPQTGTSRNPPATASTATTKPNSATAQSENADEPQPAQLAFSADGKFLYCLRHKTGLEARALPGGEPPTLPLFSGDKNVTSFALASDGALAVGLEDGSLKFSCDGSSKLLTPLNKPEQVSAISLSHQMERRSRELAMAACECGKSKTRRFAK